MSKSQKTFSLIEAKIQASILLKSYRSSDKKIATLAANRFLRLSEFAECSIEDMYERDIKHKHALAVVALENGFNSWTDLKSQIVLIVGGFLNHWFASYEEAKMHQQLEGGFLFPYKNQFFICEASYIERIGIDPQDPDWQLIGCDWVVPSDKAAWRRLSNKLMKI